MLNIQCAICKEKQNIRTLYKETLDFGKITNKTFSARRIPDRVHYNFVKCSNCGLIFSCPILDPDKIIDFYLESDFDYAIEANYLKETYGALLEKILPKKNRNKLKLLDIGCGNGFFLEKAKELGIGQVLGVEPGKRSVEKAPRSLRKSIKVDVLRKGLFKNHTFDIICCFHTLDHVIDPNKFLEIIYDLLKEGGKILFVVHDTDGLSVKLFGEKSAIFDIEHIYLFNKSSLAEIFKKNHFKEIQVVSVRNRYPLDYWVRMTPFSKSIKPILLEFLKTSGLGTLPLSLKAGNIGVVATK